MDKMDVKITIRTDKYISVAVGWSVPSFRVRLYWRIVRP